MKREGIYFDARYIRVGQHDGISRFSVGLFTALSKLTEVTAIISDERQLAKLPSQTKWVKLNDPTSIAEPLIAFKLNQLGARLVFSPMQTIGSLGRKYKLILTLHDLIYYRHPTPPPSFNLAIRILWRLYHLSYWPQRLLLNRSDMVVTVSKTTQRLIRQHRLTKRPTDVIYNAAEASEADSDIAENQPKVQDRSTLIYMGSFMPYKNVETLIKAAGMTPSIELLLLSRIDADRKDELRSLATKVGARVRFLNGVSELEYHQLLGSALALVSASKDEGFGIPLVEAMQRGIPVVVSDIDIFREIGGDAAMFCAPEEPAEFAAAITSLGDEATWTHKSKLALEHAKLSSWDSSAKKLLEIIDRL